MSVPFSGWDYAVLLGMLLVWAALGVYYTFADGGQGSGAGLLTAGRGLTAPPAALSLTASILSAVTVLGVPAEVYRFGAAYLLCGVTYALVVIVTSEIYMPVFYRLRLASTHEYLELRFNKHIRLVGTVLFIVQTILCIGIVIYASALALNEVTGFELWGAVVTTGIVCTFYCSLGSLKAVVWTDVIQIFIMVAGFSSIIIQTSNLQGGFKTIIRHAKEGGRLQFWDFNPSPLQRHTFWTITIGGTFTWTSIYGVNQSQVQRYLACKTRCQAKLTVSSSINALAAVTVEDLIKPHLNSPSQKTLSLFSKGTSLFYGILCIGMAALASLMGDLLETVLSIFGMIGGPLLGLFTLGILNPFANSLGSFIGLIAGFTISLWIGIGAHIYPPPPERTLPLPLSVANCTVTRSTHLYWTKFPEHPFLRSWKTSDLKRTPIMDNLYSISYLYLSALGTLITVFVGAVFSLLTGGKEQHIDRKYLLNVKEDMTFGSFKKINEVEVSAPQN
ncbi:sodium-coupled monocarboxylate transporter 1-like isoform X2 [Notamacropus eugenii]|uniref:sodium-coupled monocarboxylate transporter 1-like isoform X2 n=1 Tax=Notamacropus eugenii TaxID=9315 RepID=UPI003B67B5FA